MVIKNKILRECGWLIPRLSLDGISFNETGTSGFGDRLRGISLALFLARFHRTRNIFYRETPSPHFPYRMVDLIRIEGFQLIPQSLPFAANTLKVEHRCAYGSSLKRWGFRYLPLMTAKDPMITQRVEQLGIGEGHFGLHIRGTDAKKRYANGVEEKQRQLIAKLEQLKLKHGDAKIFLAADSRKGIEDWSGVLEEIGFDYTFNDLVTWDEGSIRQSSASAMLVDFFGLSRCSGVLRLVPSEFSRFAQGIKSGKYKGYYKPDKV